MAEFFIPIIVEFEARTQAEADRIRDRIASLVEYGSIRDAFDAADIDFEGIYVSGEPATPMRRRRR